MLPLPDNSSTDDLPTSEAGPDQAEAESGDEREEVQVHIEAAPVCGAEPHRCSPPAAHTVPHPIVVASPEFWASPASWPVRRALARMLRARGLAGVVHLDGDMVPFDAYPQGESGE